MSCKVQQVECFSLLCIGIFVMWMHYSTCIIAYVSKAYIIRLTLCVCFAYKWEIIVYTKIIAVGLKKVKLVHLFENLNHTSNFGWCAQKITDSNEVIFIYELYKWHDEKCKIVATQIKLKNSIRLF